jgi:large subunit ribosomal protein L32
MPAVPKKRGSKARRDRRRAHDSLTAVNTVVDKVSGELRRQHHIDAATGTYKGRKLMKPKA